MLDLLPGPVYFVVGLAIVLAVFFLVKSYLHARAIDRETEKFWDL